MTAPPSGGPEPASPIGWEEPPRQRGRKEPTIKRTWLVRLSIAIVAGLMIGAGAGVVAVNRFDPGRAGQPDSLQLMLDSMAQRRASNDPRSQRRAADSSAAAQRAEHIADSTSLANDPNAPVVPSVLNLEEGAARDAIEGAGLTVGTVTFAASTAPLGVVIGTTPAVGLKVPARTAVNFVLSNGRPPSDTADSNAATAHSPPS